MRISSFVVIAVVGLGTLACGPRRVAGSGSDTTSESIGEADTDTGDDDKLDQPQEESETGDTDELEGEYQLIVALGSGTLDGEASFGPARRFSIAPSLGLTTLHNSDL